MKSKQWLYRILFGDPSKRKPHRKTKLYWFVFTALILLGMWIGSWLEKQHIAMSFRYMTYQAMQELAPGHPFVQNTVIVLIGDEEYWTGEPARRVPINREYLAKIVRALDDAKPKVIALDFDLRSPTPDGKPHIDHPAYEKERLVLLKTLDDVSLHRPIILPRTVTLMEDSYYVQEADIHDGYDFHGGNVWKGYINLPFDYRMVPLTLYMRDGSPVKSFAEAIVERVNPDALKHLHEGGEFPYGRWLTLGSFTDRHLVSASDVLNHNAEAFNKIGGNVAIIGSGWSKLAYGRGPLADEHFTPAGRAPGVFMHANYVEALLSDRTYGRWGEIFLLTIEFIFSFALAAIFALDLRPFAKLATILLLPIFLVLLSYLSFLNLGRFFDFFVPMTLVLGHAGIEQIREWRANSHEYDKLFNASVVGVRQ